MMMTDHFVWQNIRQNLLAQLENKLANLSTDDRPVFLRVEYEIQEISPLNWLMAQKSRPKIFWKNRGDSFEIAGIGVADMVESDYQVSSRTLFRRMEKYLGDSGVRYYGGIRFQQAETRSQEWQEFGVFRFSVPDIEVIRDHDQSCHIAFNLLWRGEEEPHSLLQKAEEKLDAMSVEIAAPNELSLRFRDRTDSPQLPQWTSSVEHALAMFQEGWLEKIVLARKATFDFAETLPALQLTRALIDNSSTAYTFCFEAGDDKAFLGCTPERLYLRDQRSLFSEALAGTRSRGIDLVHDLQLERELLSSAKDRYEHLLVLDNLRQAFDTLCHSINEQETVSVRKLAHLQHLHAEISGSLKDGIHDGQIVDLLNPTPAVGGSPRAAAMANIDNLEPFDRGWYAGPVGWVGIDAAEFCVAIRSALVDGPKLHVYSGAGIVEGSEPQNEWMEIESKIGQYVKILKPFLSARSHRRVRETLKKNVDQHLI